MIITNPSFIIAKELLGYTSLLEDHRIAFAVNKNCLSSFYTSPTVAESVHKEAPKGTMKTKSATISDYWKKDAPSSLNSNAGPISD